jgi:hypothetical protein
MSLNLSEKAMLVNLHVSTWTGQKLDREVSKETANQHDVQEDRVRTYKDVIDRTLLKKIKQNEGFARNFHYGNTLPWDDNGPRLLPCQNYFNYMERMRQFRSKHDSLVGEFVTVYPQLIEDAKLDMKTMFKEKDYPEPGRIAALFDFDTKVTPLADTGDFRLDLNKDEVDKLKTEYEAGFNANLKDSVKDLWYRMHDHVEHMLKRLSVDDERSFKATGNNLVTNLISLVNLLPKLNITNDPDLEAMRLDVEKQLCRFDTQVLKVDPLARKVTKDAAEKILASMQGYLGGNITPVQPLAQLSQAA